MSRLKVVLAFLIPALLLTFNSNTSFAGPIPEEQITVPLPADVNTSPYVGFIADGVGAAPGSGNSYLLGQDADGVIPEVSNVTANNYCSSLQDPSCLNAKYFKYAATLGMCTGKLIVDCITSVDAADENGKKLAVNYVRPFTGSFYTPFDGDSSVGLPSGRAAEIVDIPSAPHSGGTQYLIVVHNDGIWLAGQSKFSSRTFNAQIYAITFAPPPIGIGKVFQTTTVFKGQKLTRDPINGDFASQTSCVVYSSREKICAMPNTMPLNINFTVNVKTSVSRSGWFHGRVSNAKTTFSVDNDKSTTISFSGNPVVVPTFAAWFKEAELPPTITTFNKSYPNRVNNIGYGDKTGLFGANKKPGDELGGGVPIESAMSLFTKIKEYDQLGIDNLNLWISAAKNDQAMSSPTRWIYQNIDSSPGGATPPPDTKQPQVGPGGQQQGKKVDPMISCYAKNMGNFSGVVSTNATQYISGPPTFDQTTQSLDYAVAAPHLLANGNVFEGSYNLEIDASLARCIYGLTDAPISATISVIGIDGVDKVATKSIGFSPDGKYLRLSAAGFTFSSPIIRVKLAQNGSVTAKSTVPAPTKASVATKVITCVKGKISKRVSGTNPKCPIGYIKK